MAEYRHRVSGVDTETRRGVCAECGPVRVKPKRHGTYWACARAESQWSQGRHAAWRLTPREQAAMLEAQGGLCALCHHERNLVVDHCHTSGRVRGLLCNPCNSRLGHFEGAWGVAATAYVAG